MTIKITNVKIVGLCSKCRKEGDKIPRDINGREIKDSEISCICSAFTSQRKNEFKIEYSRCIFCDELICPSNIAGKTKEGIFCNRIECIKKVGVKEMCLLSDEHSEPRSKSREDNREIMPDNKDTHADKSLSEKLNKADNKKQSNGFFWEKDVKQCFKEIIEICEDEDFDVMVHDGSEDDEGEITISLADFIKRRIGKELIC